VTESHLISGLVHQLVAAEHTHTFAESEALLPLLPRHLGQAGTTLCAQLNADDATVNQLMHALQAARPEADFLAWKASLASERSARARPAPRALRAARPPFRRVRRPPARPPAHRLTAPQSSPRRCARTSSASRRTPSRRSRRS
jgi:hypothetical protein